MERFKERRDVRVEFIDADSGQVIAQSQMPPDELPESFQASTTVESSDKTWEIVRAEPTERSAWESTRNLKLWVRELKRVPLQDILFSLPTICEFIPGLIAPSAGEKEEVLRLHEDEWRQIEFVSLDHEESIEANLQAIRQIYEQEQRGLGFRKIHVRKEPSEPLRGRELHLEELLVALGPDLRRLDGVAYLGASEVIERGFGLETGNLIELYGIEKGGLITTLGLIPLPEKGAPGAPFLEFARKHELCLVDWCRAWKVIPIEEEFRRYFDGEDS